MIAMVMNSEPITYKSIKGLDDVYLEEALKKIVSYDDISLLTGISRTEIEKMIIEFIRQSIKKIEKLNLEVEGLEVLSNKELESRKKKKSRWTKKAKDKINDYIETEILDLKVYLQQKDSNGGLDVTSEESVRKMKAKFLDNITRWQKDKNYIFINGPIITDFGLKKKIRILEDDVYFFVLSQLIIEEKERQGRKKGAFREKTTPLIDNPIFSMSSSLLKMEETNDTKLGRLLINDYNISDNYFLRTLIKEPQKITLDDCYSLDERDSEIIDFLYSNINPDFYRDRAVVVDLKDIAIEVYGRRNGYTYNDIEKRISKLTQYQIMGVIKEGKNIRDTKFVINFFDNAVITTNPDSGVRYVRIVFGELLYSHYIQNKTVKVASTYFEKLSSNSSRILLFPLQKERLHYHIYADLSDEFKFTLNFFKTRIRFNYKSRRKIAEQISESLDELINNGLIVESYRKDIIDDFYIKFLPFSNEEKNFFGID